MHLLFTISLLPTVTLTLTLPRPHCQEPIPPLLPLFSDCDHVLHDIRKQTRETGNPLFTASRRDGSNMHLPNLYWDHIPQSTCAIYVDMINSRPDSSDILRLSDVTNAMEAIARECAFYGHEWELNEGWTITGRAQWVNVSIERLHWPGPHTIRVGNLTTGNRGNETVAE